MKVVLTLGNSSYTPTHNVTKIITSITNDMKITIRRETKTRVGSFFRDLRNMSLNILGMASTHALQYDLTSSGVICRGFNAVSVSHERRRVHCQCRERGTASHES